MRRWMIHTAVTIVDPTGILDQLGVPVEKDQDVCQFAAEFPLNRTMSAVPERYFRKAFREMEEACLEKARRAGLIKD